MSDRCEKWVHEAFAWDSPRTPLCWAWETLRHSPGTVGCAANKITAGAWFHSMKYFHHQDEENYFSPFPKWKHLQYESQKTSCVLSTCCSGFCKKGVRNTRVRGHWSVFSRNFPWAVVSLCLFSRRRRRQKSEPVCIWPIMQCSVTRGNSFLTPAGEQLCPGAQDGHAL